VNQAQKVDEKMIIPVNQAQKVDEKMVSCVYFSCINFMISAYKGPKRQNVINKR